MNALQKLTGINKMMTNLSIIVRNGLSIALSLVVLGYVQVVTAQTGLKVQAEDIEPAAKDAVTNTSSIALENSEFDNHSEAFVKGPNEADPEYEDTEFGELLYNEASLPTRLEILRLLSKDTPSMMVFLHAVAMGLGVDDVLDAAIKYEPNRGRDFASSAISILPVLTESTAYIYGKYELEDLEREDESKPYMAQQVIDRFFDDRTVLTPYPDWFEGQFHFRASAAELKLLSEKNTDVKWYRSKSNIVNKKRPIFVNLYESNQAILVDGQDRIEQVLQSEGAEATLPVVFIFNRLNERPVDQLGYPATIRGVQQAYAEEALMVTPTPEWQNGEYHLWANIEEIYSIFDIPEEEDFEPEYWQSLLEEAEAYKVSNTAFLFVVLSSGEDDIANKQGQYQNGQQYTAWDDPRTESAHPYTPPNDDPITLKSLIGEGLIINRPDLIAALNALGVTQVPVAFYYIDSARTKPYVKGPRGLRVLAVGGGVPPVVPPGGGGFGPPPPVAPPPPEEPPAPPPPPPPPPPPEEPPVDCPSPPCNQ